MADLPEWVSTLPSVGKWIAGVVAGLAALVASWTALGFPVFMSDSAHHAHHEREDQIAFARAAVEFARKAVDRAEDGTLEQEEARAALEAAQARLDELEGG